MSSPDNPVMETLENVARAGAGRAGAALSTLLGRGIAVEHLETRYVPSASGAILLSLEVQHDHAAVGQLQIHGQVEGTAFVVMSQRSIEDMLASFGIEPEEGGSLGEMGDSLLREVSNITASSYINALADEWKLDLSPSTVDLNLASEGFSAELEEAARRQGAAIVFRCAFSATEGTFQMSLVMLLDSSDVTMFAQAG